MKLFNIIFLCGSAFASERVETLFVPFDEPRAVYVRQGLVSVLEFNQGLLEVRVGNPHVLKALISEVKSNELTVFWAEGHPKVSNLIVRAGRETFVLDVVPSSFKHQDFVKVRRGYQKAAFLKREESQDKSLQESVPLNGEPQVEPPKSLLKKVNL